MPVVIVYAFFTGYSDSEAGMEGDEHIDAEEYVHLTCCGLVSAFTTVDTEAGMEALLYCITKALLQ